MTNKVKITKPIRLIELFAGVGTQAMSLLDEGIDFEHYKISEWQVDSIIAYAAIHKDNRVDHTQGYELQQLKDILKNFGLSSDGKELIKPTTIQKWNEEKVRTIINAIIDSNNLGSILNIKGPDLQIVEREIYDYVMSYSFPCQSVSISGKQEGFAKGSGTRSGLLWEVERLLLELGNDLPQALLMENVPNLLSDKFMPDFQLWVDFLASLGYTNTYFKANAKDFNVAQNRNRVFMVSTLAEGVYEPPKGVIRTKTLQDFLETEEEVGEEYYLTDTQVAQITKWKAQQDPIKNSKDRGSDVVQTILARGSADMSASMILIKEYNIGASRGRDPKDPSNREIGNPKLEQRLEINKQGIANTLTTNAQRLGMDSATFFNVGTRYRKLTEKEAWRLMGIKDEYFYKAKNVGISKTQLYKQAGNAIVVDVLRAIFRELVGKE